MKDVTTQKKVSQWLTLPLLGAGVLVLALVVVVGLSAIRQFLLGSASMERKTVSTENTVRKSATAVLPQEAKHPVQQEKQGVMLSRAPEGEPTKERHPTASDPFFSDKAEPPMFTTDPPDPAKVGDSDEETPALLREALPLGLQDAEETAADATPEAPEPPPSLAETQALAVAQNDMAELSAFGEALDQLEQRTDIDEETRARLHDELQRSFQSAEEAASR